MLRNFAAVLLILAPSCRDAQVKELAERVNALEALQFNNANEVGRFQLFHGDQDVLLDTATGQTWTRWLASGGGREYAYARDGQPGFLRPHGAVGAYPGDLAGIVDDSKE